LYSLYTEDCIEYNLYLAKLKAGQYLQYLLQNIFIHTLMLKEI